LRAILVHDSETIDSSATLEVVAGSALEPTEYPGLAELLHHMLFVGTDKYPEEKGFAKYLSDFGGSEGRSINLENTNYHFKVSNEGFDKALDMFAQFFISPLMSKDAVDAKIHEVDSGYNNELLFASYRFDQILQNESAPTCAYNRPTTGNSKTLKKDGVVEALVDFHKKWYSSNIMNLCVVSDKSLDDQEKMVKELFSAVVDSNVTVPSFKEPKCYPSERLGQLYKIKSLKDRPQIKFVWFYEYLDRETYGSTLDILNSVLAQEGENSICSYLMAEGLATYVSSYFQDHLGAFH
jgi:insulysin